MTEYGAASKMPKKAVFKIFGDLQSSLKCGFTISMQTKFSISLTKHFEELGDITLGSCKKQTKLN